MVTDYTQTKKLMKINNLNENKIAAMLASDEGFEAAVSFCEGTMHQKESTERDRERADPARRNRRRGRSRGG